MKYKIYLVEKNNKNINFQMEVWENQNYNAY